MRIVHTILFATALLLSSPALAQTSDRDAAFAAFNAEWGNRFQQSWFTNNPGTPGNDALNVAAQFWAIGCRPAAAVPSSAALDEAFRRMNEDAARFSSTPMYNARNAGSDPAARFLARLIMDPRAIQLSPFRSSGSSAVDPAAIRAAARKEMRAEAVAALNALP